MNNDARVMLWGSLIGAVTWLEDREIGVFQYSPDFLSMITLMRPPMIALMGPFQTDQKAVFGPASNYCFSPPFEPPFLGVF